MTAATLPRPAAAPVWKEGDLVLAGKTRWIIRSIRGPRVHLCASSAPGAGIHWHTPLNNLPTKTGARA